MPPIRIRDNMRLEPNEYRIKIADMTVGLRVTEEEEREGLDISSHGEAAYSR